MGRTLSIRFTIVMVMFTTLTLVLLVSSTSGSPDSLTDTVSINSGDTYTASTSVTLTVSTLDYGVKGMRFSNFPDAWFWGIFFPWVWSDWYEYETTAPWTLTAGDGTKTVYAQFINNEGIMTSFLSIPSDTIILDTTPPTGSIVINGDDTYTTSTPVTLDLTYSDATSGVEKVRYSNDGVWDTEPWETPSATKAWVLTVGDGTKTVYYQVRDTAGLISDTYSDTIILDTAPPTGSIIINGGDTYTTSASVTLYLTYSDATSGVDMVRYSNDGVWDTEPWETPSATKAWTLTGGDGTKTVYYKIRDKTGWVSDTYMDTIVLGRLGPTGSIVINGGDIYTTSTSVTLYLTYSDATSGVDMVRYSDDGVWDTEPWEFPSATKAWVLTVGDGTKTVYYQVRNNIGFVSSTCMDTIILDTVAPTGSIVINGGDTGTTWPLVTLTLTYSDATSGVDVVIYRNDGEAWLPWEAPSAFRLWLLRMADGTRTVFYQIRDKAGWVSTIYSDTIILDSTPPTTTIHHSSGTVWLTYIDSGSGVKNTYYRIDGGTWITYTGLSFSVPGTGGTRKIEAYSTDNAGNAESPKTLKVHYLSVSVNLAGIWTPPWSGGWYTEGTTANGPTADSYGDKTTYSPWGEPIYTYYTFSTWKKDSAPVSGNPISVLMDGPHWIEATYFGCEMTATAETCDTITIKLRITTGTSEYVRLYYTLSGPDYYSEKDIATLTLPGNFDYQYGPETLEIPCEAPEGHYYGTIWAEDATTGWTLSYTYITLTYGSP